MQPNKLDWFYLTPSSFFFDKVVGKFIAICLKILDLCSLMQTGKDYREYPIFTIQIDFFFVVWKILVCVF